MYYVYIFEFVYNTGLSFQQDETTAYSTQQILEANSTQQTLEVEGSIVFPKS